MSPMAGRHSSTERKTTASVSHSDNDAEKDLQPKSAPALETLPPATEKVGHDGTEHAFTIDWLSPGSDPRNPQAWSFSRKWMTIALVTGITLIPALTSTAFAPAVPLLMHDLHSSDTSLTSFTVSIYIMGYVLGPLLYAPMSEIYGRAMILHIANLAFVITAIVCAVSNSLGLFIVFRLFMGFAGCASVTLGGGVIADLMPPEERGLAMSVWSAGPILGPTIGPAIGGYLAQNAGWRWVFWLPTIALGTLTCACFFLLKETYGPRILEKIAADRRRATGDSRYHSALHKDQTHRQLLRTALVRPAKMLLRSPIVALLAFYTSIINAYCTILFATIGTVYERSYAFAVGEAGLAYFGLMAGFLIGQITIGAFSDRYVKHMKSKHPGGTMKPEHRLPPLILGSLLLPTGFFWYGWAIQAHTHWMVSILGSSLVGIASMFSYLPVQLYLVDTYTVFAASAIASNSVVRSVCAALVPLGAEPLYQRTGYGWGNSILGFIAVGFVPVAILLLLYGERIRTNPKFQPRL